MRVVVFNTNEQYTIDSTHNKGAQVACSLKRVGCWMFVTMFILNYCPNPSSSQGRSWTTRTYVYYSILLELVEALRVSTAPPALLCYVVRVPYTVARVGQDRNQRKKQRANRTTKTIQYFRRRGRSLSPRSLYQAIHQVAIYVRTCISVTTHGIRHLATPQDKISECEGFRTRLISTTKPQFSSVEVQGMSRRKLHLYYNTMRTWASVS